MKKTHKNHAVFSLGYHIIWCPKYRHDVLVGQVALDVKNIIAQTCGHYGWSLEEIAVEPDHVHIFVTADPNTAPVEIAKTLKSISAVYIFTKHPDVKKRKFWGSGLWSRSTFYSTVGSVSENAIRHYIQNQ